MKAVSSGLFFALLLCGVVTEPARADEAIGGTIGLSLAPLVGSHVESNSLTHTPPVPLPIAQVSLRDGRFGVFFESLPTSPAIDLQGTNGQAASTRLAFFDAVARVYDDRNRFWIGGGEIGYDQSTTYPPNRYARYGAVSASRVVGGRYEFGAGLAKNPARLRLWLDFMPSLHGINDQYFYRSHGDYPENGSQFETQLAVANAKGPFEFDYGVRYVNYLAHYTFNGSLADRNTGFLPYATFAYRFGSRR